MAGPLALGVWGAVFRHLARVTERFAWPIVAGWSALAVVLLLTAPSIEEVGTFDESAFLPDDSPSQRAERLLQAEFPDDPTRDSAVVVVSRPGGLTDADAAFVADLVAWLGSAELASSVEQVRSAAEDPSLRPILRAPDGEAELVMVGFADPPFTAETTDAVDRIRERLHAAPEGLDAHLTGIAGLASDQGRALIESFDRTALVTLLLVVAILVYVYRSAVTPLIPLASIVVSFLVARGVVALLAERGFEVASLAETFMVVMIFGAGTDYCLFIVSRYREDLQEGRPIPDTVRRTMTVIGAVIAASAATVIVGFLSQATAEFGMFRTMGPAMGLSILVTLAVGLTFTPAMLRLTGRRAFWPAALEAVRERSATTPQRWVRAAAFVRTRPTETLLGGTVLLVFAAGGLGWYGQSFDLVSELPAKADARQGFEALARHYPGGALAPVFVVVDAGSPILEGQRLEAIDRLTDALREERGIAEVRSVTQPAGAPLTLESIDALDVGGGPALGLDPNTVDLTPLVSQLSAPEGLRLTTPVLARYPQIADQLSFFLGRSGESSRLMIAMEGNPYSRDALDVFRDIDDRAAAALEGTALAGADLAVGGPPAFSADMQDIGNRDFRVIAAVVIAAVFVLLAVLLRAVFAPFYLLGTVLLSYAATIGATSGLFVGLLGEPGLPFWLPSFLFVILVALGADYNIFIISRVREEAERGWSVAEAASRGLVFTGPVITSAGLILAGTFAALLLAPMPSLRQIGFAVTLGVLLDTFVVRPLLVPSITILLGRWAFWPATPGMERSRAWRARPIGVAVGAIAVAAALLAALVATGSRNETVTRVATSATTIGSDAAPGTPSSTDATPGATVAAAAAEPAARVGESPPATVAAPTSPPQTQRTTGAGPRRLAPPAPGEWRFATQGTRRFGVAGSTESFEEESTTEVRHGAGGDEGLEVRLRTQSSSGTQEDVRRYTPDRVDLLSTTVTGAGASFGGTFEPPQTLIHLPLRNGDRWVTDWTTEGARGTTSSEVLGQRSVETGTGPMQCWDVRSVSSFEGDVSGEREEVACWVPELGIAVEETESSRGTYRGIPFELHTRSVLLSSPRG